MANREKLRIKSALKRARQNPKRNSLKSSQRALTRTSKSRNICNYCRRQAISFRSLQKSWKSIGHHGKQESYSRQ